MIMNKCQVLKPDLEEAEIAERSFEQCFWAVPSIIRRRLAKRKRETGNFINCIRYLAEPVPISIVRVNALIEWGHLYADLLERITHAFFSARQSQTKQFLEQTIISFLLPWQKELLSKYKTQDHLAGAHIGDDNFCGKSIEWNVGAVGGLEEASGAAERVFTNRRFPDDSLQTSSIESVYAAILYGYESFCLANNLPVKEHPRIAYLEHDDFYYSSVRTVHKLRSLGADVIYAFHHSLTTKGGYLKTNDGRSIDVVYLDFHIEDLNGNHPVVQTLSANSVALDCSIFARLVLRSKALFALLAKESVLKELGLTRMQIEKLKKHLAKTVLFKDYETVRENPSFSEKIAVKIGRGSVFGGYGVYIADRNTTKASCINSFKELKALLKDLAPLHAKAGVEHLMSFTRTPLVKSLFKELWVTSASEKDVMKFKNFQKRINQRLAPETAIGFSLFTDILQEELFQFFGKDRINNKILERILKAYSEFFMSELSDHYPLPVVAQEYILPEILRITGDLYISHRIHVLFCKNKKMVFLCGSQVFPIKDGKQDNQHKMTCILLSNESLNHD